MNLTYNMMEKLRAVGFEFKQLEHMCSPGMTFFHDGCEYTVGGAWDGSECTAIAQKIAREGMWLPDEGDLARWLELTDHKMEIRYEDFYYYGKATDSFGNAFEGSGPDLLCCLYKMIYKICRKANGTVKPESILILDVINDVN